MDRTSKLMAGLALAAALLFSGSALATPAAAEKGKETKAAAKVATPAATPQEISDAKAKGLVWVNLSSKVYHKEGQFYGKTKQGKFMTEADAQKAGFRAAQEPKPPKKAAPAKK